MTGRGGPPPPPPPRPGRRGGGRAPPGAPPPGGGALSLRARAGVWAGVRAAAGPRLISLERPPLVRFTLVRFGAGEHRMVMTNHHIVWDGWSSAVLLRELLTGYA
ncbi:condensation domain-containing protein, partial [Streptomyces nojiriensis]|uniref:condensation domain-containing protein n=1 Tax=Streptomyces nojiriensis TaxID=66374 RepID=UPI00365F3D47